jgi:hypothetical protein
VFVDRLIRQLADAGWRMATNYLPPILNMVVPQSGHLLFIAGLPFFIVTLSNLSVSFLARHLTQ